MSSALREIWKYRELLFILVRRDLKVRYKNSILGFGWSLINPLLQVLIIAVVIEFTTDTKTESYHAYVFCAMLPWLFFSTGTMDGAASVINYYNLIRRVYFPREIIPLATVLSNLVHLALATCAFLIYMVLNTLYWWVRSGVFAWPIQATTFLLPIPILGLVVLLMGISLVFSVWTLNFEDMRYIIDSGLRIFYWLVPLLYWPEIILHRDLKGYQGLVYTLYMLNPVAAFMNAFRKLTLPPTETMGVRVPPMGFNDWMFLLAGLITSLLVLALGFRYFEKKKWTLAERV